jgi:hypothetical protein
MLLGVPCAMSQWRMPRRHVVCVQAVHPLDDRSSERDLLPAALMCARARFLPNVGARAHTAGWQQMRSGSVLCGFLCGVRGSSLPAWPLRGYAARRMWSAGTSVE